jgi:hypothetical protein
MLDKTFRNDLRHDLVGAVDALAALKPQREGDRVGKVGGARSALSSVPRNADDYVAVAPHEASRSITPRGNVT